MRNSKQGNTVIILIVIGAVVLAGIGGYVYLNSQKTTPPTSPVTTPTTNTQVPSALQATAQPTTPTTKKQINTIEEAMTFALSGSGMNFADSAHVDRITVIYTATLKDWTFHFISRTNPHPSSITGATVYDEPWQDVEVFNDGRFTLSQGIISKDNQQGDPWTYKATPAQAAVSNVFDLAKQKVTAAGLAPGTIIYAKFSSLGVQSDTSGFNNTWDVNVVLAGEEGNQNKKAKDVEIKNGQVTGMSDSTVQLY